MLVAPLSASMRFTEAAESFLQSRSTINAHGRIHYVAPRTYRDYADQLAMATQFFGALKLDEIHAGHLRTYQMQRSNGDGFVRKTTGGLVPTRAGAAKINDELGLVRRIMLLAEAWGPKLAAAYLPLQEEDIDIPKALSPEEQDHFLSIAASNPDWYVIWWYSLVALHTTFSSDEMRTIRQGDINLTQQILAVNRKHGKNQARRREVPIVDGACMYALEELLKRAIELGGRGPHLHLFPKREVRNRYNGNRHISPTGLRKDFLAVRERAGLPWFCINGLRHTAITRMAEAGIPIAVIMKRAGHMTPKMSAHYTHISEQSERLALSQMMKKKPVVSISAAQLRRNFAIA